jgi:hypothetical protein
MSQIPFPVVENREEDAVQPLEILLRELHRVESVLEA